MSDLIQVINLKKYFNTPAGKVHAVDQINISIPEGETLGVVGESGCGKSTLGRVILRLSEATSGQVLFEGKDILKFNKAQMKEARTKMQIIFQDPYSSLDPRMTVMDLIKEPLLINHMYKSRSQLDEYVLELMDKVGLARRLVNSYPHELDGGRRQRIGVARALAVRPKFIVCDEPVSALDVSIQAQILNLLMDLQEEMGLTYLFISHQLQVVQKICDNIGVLYLGSMMEISSSEKLYGNPLHPYTKMLIASILPPDPKNQVLDDITADVGVQERAEHGCKFHNRCPWCTEKCKNETPALREAEPGHFVACWRY